MRPILGVLLSASVGVACASEITGGPQAVVDGGPDTASATCLAEEERPGALLFDGVDDQVSMGAAPELGLAEFTVEAWVRRDARGKESGTGVGGIRIVPIAGKGRGEKDGSNLDCNYAFGFAGEVLGADFEDTASGANHPVRGTTAVPYGEWHHVAASYDGTTWRLFLDGKVDAEKTVDATPRADSIQHFGIGTLLNSTGAPSGALAGAVDEVRVWNRARSASEIADSMYTAMVAGEGLVARYALDSADVAADSMGANDGSIVGAGLDEDSVALDRGLPPRATAAGPGADSVVTGDTVTLNVDVQDPDGDDYLVTYHLRELSEADDFSVVVLPDTQYYTDKNRGFEQYFYDQTAWIRENRSAYNIVSVIHNGDITDRGDEIEYQWTVADTAMSTLESPEDGLADGLPYGVAVGNHDNRGGTTTLFNKYFGVSRFAGRSYYGGHYDKTNNQNWMTFSSGTIDFVVVSLEFDLTPDKAIMDWARSIFEMHPNHFGILNSHYIMGRTASFGDQGAAIYDALKDVDNLQLMTCGHITGETRRTDEFEGNAITTMLADYQSLYKGTPEYRGGSGYLRIWEFSPANGELTVRTYSPSLDDWQTDDNSEFTFPVDLRGAGGSFDEVVRVEHAKLGAAAEVGGLEPGKTYEWYAMVTDCQHTTTTPVQRFTTQAL